MRPTLGLVVPLAAALLQAAVVPFLEVGGARPNLVVLAAASWSLAAGPREAVWWAFIGGLAMDLLSGGPLGASALAALVPVAAVGIGDVTLRPRSTPSAAVLVGLAGFAAGALYALLLALVGRPLGGPSEVLVRVGGAAIYTGVLAVATYPIARRVCRSVERQASFGW